MTGLGESLDILMFATLCVVLLAGFPAAFTLAGVALVFGLIGYALGVFDLGFFYAFPQRIYGTMTNEVLIAVPLFVFMGVMLERSRVAEDLLETMGRLFGRMPGGLGISVSVVGALLAASTGIVGATVVTMTLLSLPVMLRHGYSPSLASGSIAAAGTLGQIIPPSIVLVVLGDQISNSYQKAQLDLGNFAPDTVSVGDLFAGALIPGLLLVVLYIVYQAAVAFLRPERAPAMPPMPGMRVTGRDILNALVPPITLIVAVLGSILGGVATPTEAAAVGAVGAILLAGHRLDPSRPVPVLAAFIGFAGLVVLANLMDLRVRRTVISGAEWAGIALAFLFCLFIAWGLLVALRRAWTRERVLAAVMETTMRITAMVFVILIGAALFTLVFRGLGGEALVRDALSAMPGGALGAIVAVMLLMFLLGFFLDFLEIVFIVVPLVAPVLLMMEMPGGGTMNPVWLGIMMAVNLQTSFLTPPFGFALFYLRGVAPPDFRTIDLYRGIVPFVLIQLGLLVVLWFAPGLATWLPGVVYGN